MEGNSRVITVVCTGNICRSPMAERLLAHALAAEMDPLRSLRVRSAGLSAAVGDAPSANSVKALKAVDINLEDHRSRPFSPSIAESSDLILTMTSSHRDAIQLNFPSLGIPVYRFREWVRDGSREVPDPFGGPLDLYTETRDSLAEAVPSILNFLKKDFLQ
ncbi:MAG: low molecular weight protein arginine phosphatase [Oceanipulchritudo sp.]